MSAVDTAEFAATTGRDKIQAMRQQARLSDQYVEDLRLHVAPLAAALHRHARSSARPVLVGLNGCQGSGKSTLARFLAAMLQIGADMHCAVISIDDFYLGKSAREQLARDVHPLLATRGVPGTHDLALANLILDALLDPTRAHPLRVPVFNKASDDREPVASWPTVAPGIDLILLEGWCVGCPPQDAQALGEPVNPLERDEDPDRSWRRYVNDALASGYRQLFHRLDWLVMLAAPSFDCVYDWRDQQEQQLAQALLDQGNSAQRSNLLSGRSLQRFIQHFERLTRHQLDTLPMNADAVIELAPDHRMIAHRGALFA